MSILLSNTDTTVIHAKYIYWGNVGYISNFTCSNCGQKYCTDFPEPPMYKCCDKCKAIMDKE